MLNFEIKKWRLENFDRKIRRKIYKKSIEEYRRVEYWEKKFRKIMSKMWRNTEKMKFYFTLYIDYIIFNRRQKPTIGVGEKVNPVN